MRLLLTRPALPDDPLPDLLRAAGHEVICDPLLTIHPIDPPAFQAAGAIVVTSSNALRCLQSLGRLAPLTSLPVIAVGAASAAVAKTLGFSDVREGPGSAADLADELRHLAPPGCHLLYLRGEDIAYDLAPAMSSAGFTFSQALVYRSVAATALSNATRDALASGTLGAVVLMSPKTAKTYAKLVARHGLLQPASRLQHYCLSANVEAALAPFRPPAVRLPSAPNIKELVALIGPAATHSRSPH